MKFVPYLGHYYFFRTKKLEEMLVEKTNLSHLVVARYPFSVFELR